MVIGVTGLVGSGKSTVAQYLSDAKSIIVDADAIVHQQWDRLDPQFSSALIEQLGPQVISECGTVDRQSVRKFLAKHPNHIVTVEQLLHPRVRWVMQGVIQAHPDERIILDVPLLFEANLQELCDITIQVSADESVRFQRLVARDGIDKAEQLMQINRRAWSQDEREKRATYVIDSSGSFEQLYEQVQSILSKISLK